MIRLLGIGLCAALLAGCGGTPRPHPLAVPDPFQTPLPFIQANQNEELVSSITAVASISISPLEAEGVLPRDFASAVAEEAQALDVPASSWGGASSYKLEGAVVLSGADPNTRQVNVEINWNLTDARGAAFQTFAVTEVATFADAPLESGLFVPDDWWQAMAQRSAQALQMAIDQSPEMAARSSGVSDGRLGPPIVVPPVIGAPGDGNESLTRAIRALLGNAEINVVDPARPPDVFRPEEAFTLQGQVALGEVMDNGGQVINLAWDLYDAEGQHLGNVAQQNLIEPGSLDGPWGETAVFAAMAATDGISQLLSAALPGR